MRLYYLQYDKNLPIIWLVKYPKANADNIQPCRCKFQPNTFVIGTIAMGIITRSALLIKLAKLHRATIRDVRVNQRILAIFWVALFRSVRRMFLIQKVTPKGDVATYFVYGKTFYLIL